LTGGALAAVLSQKVASAGVPLSVVASTITTASLLAAGKAASGAISVKVAALTEGVLNTMLMVKVKTVVGMLLAVAVIGFGVGLLCYGTAVGQQGDGKKNRATAPPIQEGNPKSDHAKGEPTNDKEKLQGEWQAVEVEGRGERAPAELSKRFRILFKGEGIVLTTPQEESKGEFKIDSRKSPKQIDIVPLDGPLAGKTIAGIYSLDKEMLMICLPDAAKAPDQRPQAFKTGEGNGQFLLKLRRKPKATVDEPASPPDRAGPKKDKTPKENLAGAWAVVSVKDSQKNTLDFDPIFSHAAGTQAPIRNARLTLRGGKFTLKTGLVSLEGTYAFDPSATPKEITLSTTESGGVLAIPGEYSLDEDKLTITFGRLPASLVAGLAGREPGVCYTVRRERLPKKDADAPN
jgi:uncharacterized protein (TIGR03067 family)